MDHLEGRLDVEAVIGGGQGGGGYGCPGHSFGGNLRKGPGVDWHSVGATLHRQALTLISDSSIHFNGYSFRMVRMQAAGRSIDGAASSALLGANCGGLQ